MGVDVLGIRLLDDITCNVMSVCGGCDAKDTIEFTVEPLDYLDCEVRIKDCISCAGSGTTFMVCDTTVCDTVRLDIRAGMLCDGTAPDGSIVTTNSNGYLPNAQNYGSGLFTFICENEYGLSLIHI